MTKATVDPQRLQIRRIRGSDQAELGAFECGDDDLNGFLRDDALRLQERNTVVTYLAFYDGDLAGYPAPAVEAVHPADAEDAIGLEGARRSMRRRVRAVHAALLAIVTLMPDRFAGIESTVTGLRAALSTKRVLVALRELAARHLPALPTPLGFCTRASA